MALLLRNETWNTDPSQPVNEVDIGWNMWTRRDQPYHDLDVGTRVILVSGGGPGVGVLTWEVEVVAVVREAYESHEEAWRLLRRDLGPERLKMMGVTRQSFLENEYTRQAPSAGWLLGWVHTPRRKLMLPRPDDLRFRPNGWAIEDRIVVDGESIESSVPRQGRISDPVLRRAIELAAMRHVEEWLKSEGYRDIRDTSATKPFDFEVGPLSAPILRIEVKGTIGAFGPVEVTAGEVRSARESGVPTILAIVHGIRLTLDSQTGVWLANDGHLQIIDPWTPDDRTLTPVAYTYDPLASVLVEPGVSRYRGRH